jgi:predicted RNase H-like nuclease
MAFVIRKGTVNWQATTDCETVLGLDAAWTENHPSGVSLVSKSTGRWKCVAVAPSYQAFFDVAEGRAVDWYEHPTGSAPNPSKLLDAAANLLDGQRVSLVAVDMPLSSRRITGRRGADIAVSREFGKYGCAVHTPNAKRPGSIGEALTRGFEAEGYRLATKERQPHEPRTLLEVYPHPALLRLLQLDYRLPYKVSKTSRYWPSQSIENRVRSLIKEFRRILAALSGQISGIDLTIPDTTTGLSRLKPYEDALDSLVCAWVGIRYLRNKAVPYGDEEAAIWVPE